MHRACAFAQGDDEALTNDRKETTGNGRASDEKKND